MSVMLQIIEYNLPMYILSIFPDKDVKMNKSKPVLLLLFISTFLLGWMIVLSRSNY